ncbi:hypothetical protein MTO96_040772 [Rhipicephalus appendiculatus]
MLVSDVYGGRASDKYIVKTCEVEQYLLPGDEIMADRGFKLHPYLEVQGIKMNMPAFTKGKDQLRESEVTETRRIASLRIRIERAINRIKRYRIFKQVLPIKSKRVDCLFLKLEVHLFKQNRFHIPLRSSVPLRCLISA